MSTRIPRAWETSWAQEAIRKERERPADQFEYQGHDQKPSGDVVYLVDAIGICRPVDAELVRTEAWRIGDAMARGLVAGGCSDNIAVAPARGRVDEFREGYWAGDGPDAEWRTEVYRSGCAGRVRDVFDTMVNQSRRSGGKGKLTVGQVHAGREYRALVERVNSAGFKGSAVFRMAMPRRAGKTEFMDAFMRDCQRLSLFHAAMGDQIAKDTKRRLQAREGQRVIGDVELRAIGRQIITVRALVDAVCIHEVTLSHVLQRHGWRGTGKNIKSLRDALCAALERMQGI